MASKKKPIKSKVGKGKAVPAAGFVFGNPLPIPDDYTGFSQQDVVADSAVKSADHLEPFPASRTPEVLSLDSVIGAGSTAQIQAAKSIVIHCVGDSGGVKEPSKQFAVADAMAADLTNKTYQTGRPAFFYHLGDVVYYFGQERYYYDQFYDPYRNYDGPIFAIPGNHDGMVAPSIGDPTLAGFLENFCTAQPGHNPDAQGMLRTTMTQPGAYFTLDAPFVRIIGLYSNTSEGTTQGVISGPVVGDAQLTFLQQQLQATAQQRASGDRRALLIAVHHPAFTGSQDHAPSPNVLKDIDSACQAANILPDMVLSGHSHLYERYTRVVGVNQIPFVVAGTGGYFNLSGFKNSKNGKPPKTPSVGSDLQGNKLTLEKFNSTTFGFLRLTLSAASIQCVLVTVDPATGKTGTFDPFTVDLNAHTVKNG
ncbi:MAG TPA: metallophosphoesterase [Bryobacteraceae bacterium]|jgi:predicted phosphodiesterase